LLPLRKEDGGKSMKVRFLTDSGSTSNPIEALLGSDKVALLRNLRERNIIFLSLSACAKERR
jgi:hypothetical protein